MVHERKSSEKDTFFKLVNSESLTPATIQSKQALKALNFSKNRKASNKVRMPYFTKENTTIKDFDAHSDLDDQIKTPNMLIDEATLPKKFKEKLKF